MHNRFLVSSPVLTVTVCWSSAARRCTEVQLQLPVGSCVADALRASQLLTGVLEADIDALATGIWGRKVPPQTLLRVGDRVEAYRELKVDPKVARRERFTRQGARAAGLFSKRRAGAKSGY